jgi:hypothetical protein
MNRRTALTLILTLPVVGLTSVPAQGFYELPMSDRERFERAWAAGGPSSKEWAYVRDSLPLILESELSRKSIFDRWLAKVDQWHGSTPSDHRSITNVQDVREVCWLIDVGSALRIRYEGTRDFPAVYNNLWILGVHYNKWLLDASPADIAHAEAYFPVS